MNPSGGFYRVCYCLARAVLSLFYWFEVIGKENIPKGAAVICANHSALLDPFLLAFVLGINHQVHFVGKVELFRIPIVSWILKKLGMISVNRGMLDVQTVRKTLGYLSDGEIVSIFPEGTRSKEDSVVPPRYGAVKIADRAEAPIIPAYIPRKKKVFRKFRVIIGEPYYIEKQETKRTLEDYSKLAEDLMMRINKLKET